MISKHYFPCDSGNCMCSWLAVLVAAAVSGGYGQEANPLLRPFAHSNSIYAAKQVSPAVMDYLGKRLMVSRMAG